MSYPVGKVGKLQPVVVVLAADAEHRHERSRRQGPYASSSETETVRRSPNRSRPSEKPAPTCLLIC